MSDHFYSSAQLLRVDPPVPASTVKKPKSLKLRPTPPAAVPPGAGEERRNAMQPPVEDILATIMPPKVVSMVPQQPASPSSALVARGQQQQKDQQPPPVPLVQCVSTVPATRLDVIRLQEQLDTLLLQRQARDAGLCPVRSELFGKVFDELIRQITINCPERGLLLLRIRDEIRMTSEAYRALYESSVEYGVRNAALHTHSNERLGLDSVAVDYHHRLQQLREQKRQLELKVIELERKNSTIEAEGLAQKKAAEQAHNEVAKFFERSAQQLQKQLSGETNRASGKR